MPFPEYFNEIKPVDDYALGKSKLCRETRLPSMILSFLQMYPEVKEDRSLVISGSFFIFGAEEAHIKVMARFCGRNC